MRKDLFASVPFGAYAPIATRAINEAIAMGTCRRAVANGQRAAMKPNCHTTYESSNGPPMRDRPTSGELACATASDASGTPPKGNEKRKASARVCASGPVSVGCSLRDVMNAATPWNIANSNTAIRYPGGVRNHIQPMPGANQPMAKTMPKTN